MPSMRRREFITLLGGAAVAWPLGARAQQAGKVIRIGVFGPSLNSPATTVPYQAFLANCTSLGSSRGKISASNIIIWTIPAELSSPPPN